MAGRHRRQPNPRTDTNMTVEELREKLADLQDDGDTGEDEDYPPQHGTLDDND